MKPDFVSAGSLFPSIEMDESEKEIFAKKIRHDLSANAKADSVIGKLLKTESTFMNSLGAISDFLEDSKACLRCLESVDMCPKPAKGYIKIPFYDEYRDEVRTMPNTCHYLAERNRIMSNIDPCSVSRETVYSKAVSLISKYRIYHGSMPYEGKALAEIIGKGKGFSDGSDASAIDFRCAGSSCDLLCCAAYLFARTGNKVAAIDMETLIAKMASCDDATRLHAVFDFRKACDSPVLVILDFGAYLAKRHDTKDAERLMFLLKRRLRNGRATYLSSGEGSSISSGLRKALSKCKDSSEIIDSIERITIPITGENI